MPARPADAAAGGLAGAHSPLPAELLSAQRKVVVVVGPTGIGKTRVAFEIALALHGEIVVVDSRQVYRMLDIATNKPSPEQRERVVYHMIDFVDPASDYDAARFIGRAGREIEDILERDLPAVVEGGSMMYMEALTEGFTLAGIPPNPQLRQELAQLDLQALRTRLLALQSDADIDFNNPVRMIRAIEILETAGPPLQRLRNRRPPPWPIFRIGLTAPLEVIDQRLAERSREQVERGLVAETQAALDAGVPATAPVLTGIGYAEALAHIRGEVTLEELPKVMAISNRRYARRQLRWWKRDRRIRWFDIEPDPVPAILNYVENR